MNFDTKIDRLGTHCQKWDTMERVYGVSPERGLAMWVADMDFRAPEIVQEAVARLAQQGIFGYYGDDRGYLEAICWWMRERHGWDVDEKHIFSTHGLVNGMALAVDAFTNPGDGVVIMTPVYHAFSRVIRASGRRLVECPLALKDERYEMDFSAWESSFRGDERMLILCSPHNPGGQVWTRAELRAVADFCVRHDLVLVSDEIHHDLVLPGFKHHVMETVAPEISNRLVMMTSASKTFNLAGGHTGNVIIRDPDMRARFAGRMSALGLSPNAFGLHMTQAAYSAEGAVWLEALLQYISGNIELFQKGIASIKGARFMPLEATYLAWVNFEATGLSASELRARVQGRAEICPNYGSTFGLGGEGYLRFNLATQRSRVVEAVSRLHEAFNS